MTPGSSHKAANRQLTSWIENNEGNLLAGGALSDFRAIAIEALDSLDLEDLRSSRLAIEHLYARQEPHVRRATRTRLRRRMEIVDDMVTRAQAMHVLNSLTSVQFELFLSVPGDIPVDIEAIAPWMTEDYHASALTHLVAKGLVSDWGSAGVVLSTSGYVHRRIASSFLRRKTKAVGDLLLDEIRSEWRTAVKDELGGAVRRVDIGLYDTPGISLPIGPIGSSASVPTFIGTLAPKAAVNWSQISEDLEWSILRIDGDELRFRRGAVDVLRAMSSTRTRTETFEVVTVALSDSATDEGERLGSILWDVLPDSV